jgi:hypothetical protein
MITKEILEINSRQKLEDSKVLFNLNKFDSSLYLIGYSVEMALKFKICKIFEFDEGFPENKSEFEFYKSNISNELLEEIKYLKDIRNHNLQVLLKYSGQEYSVQKDFMEEWTNILFWKPELRYQINIGGKFFNQLIIKSVEKLITSILI